MAKITVQGSILSVKNGPGKALEFDFEKLRLAYLVTTDNMRGFLTLSSWDIYTIDVDNPESGEAVKTIAGIYEAQKARGLSGVKLCLAGYGGNKLVMNLKKFHKAGTDLFGLLRKTAASRIALRQQWLGTSPDVRLQGKFGRITLNAEGAVFSDRKKISWDQVETIQLDKQESLVTVTSLLLIPKGVSSGAFSMKKYKYALRYIPNKLADLYLAECLFWKTVSAGSIQKKIEDTAREELIRDGIIPG